MRVCSQSDMPDSTLEGPSLADFDALEHAFHYVCTAEGHMDMEKAEGQCTF